MRPLKTISEATRFSLIYRLWQAPFAGQKLKPLFDHGDVGGIRSILDVGCGPGVNAPHFLDKDYIGVDIDPHYVSYASRKYPLRFVAADATTYACDKPVDAVLMNSLLHHLDDEGVSNILSRARSWLAPGGRVHIMDLVLPEKFGLTRFLALADRGRHARALGEWRRLFTMHFRSVVCQPYVLRLAGARAYEMIYFQGALQEGSQGRSSSGAGAERR